MDLPADTGWARERHRVMSSLSALPRTNRRLRLGALTGLALLATGACNGPGAAEAGQVAESFDKLAQDSPDQACNLISDYQRTTFEKEEKQPCAKALADADLPEPSSVESVDVYGHDARVVLGKDVVFLARFPEGWRVTAAGCKPRAKDDPYDCVPFGG